MPRKFEKPGTYGCHIGVHFWHWTLSTVLKSSVRSWRGLQLTLGEEEMSSSMVMLLI